MAKLTGMQKLAIVIFLASLFVGIFGTAWSISLSFSELESAENAGIGPVGNQIANAILFSAGGLIGAGLGIVLFIVGRAKT